MMYLPCQVSARRIHLVEGKCVMFLLNNRRQFFKLQSVLVFWYQLEAFTI